MGRHTFSALITLDPSAPHALVQRYLDGTQTTGVVQSCGRYLPASICCYESPSPQRVIHAVVHLPLLPGEADALFGGGQVFTVWADAIVSDVWVRGEGLLGDGVIPGREPTSDPLTVRGSAPTQHAIGNWREPTGNNGQTADRAKPEFTGPFKIRTSAMACGY